VKDVLEGEEGMAAINPAHLGKTTPSLAGGSEELKNHMTVAVSVFKIMPCPPLPRELAV